MEILILDRHTQGFASTEPWQWRLSQEGHNVDYLSFLNGNDVKLFDYDVVIAHPKDEDLSSLYEEANKRKDFKLIFFNTGTLKKVDYTTQFENKNVFYEEFPDPSELVDIINR